MSDTNATSYRLTRFTPGGVLEVIMISYPLMLTALSANLMIFCDRVILSRYSLEAMNSASAAATMYATFVFFGIGITAIAEVFVGQYNGDRKFSKMSIPVWQMIWFSLALGVIFYLIAEFACHLLIHKHLIRYGDPYFKWMMKFGFLLPLISALGSFFIGQGKTLLVTATAIISNIANFFLDIIFVFGYKDVIASMGAEGSAIASVISQSLQCIILFVVFLSPKYAKKFKTRRARLNFKLMKQCLKIGLPVAFSRTMEVLCWAIIPLFLTSVGHSYISVYSINQGIFILFAFFSDGMSKAITAIASNMLGAERKDLIKKLLSSSILVHLGIAAFLLLPMVIFPHFFVDLFLSTKDSQSEIIKYHSTLVMKPMWIFFMIDGLVWIIAGILTAGGDTRFILIANITSLWLFALTPIYIILHYFPHSPSTPGFIILVYAIANISLFLWRYFSNKWHTLKINTNE